MLNTMSTAPTGCWPMAVSAASTSPLAPSRSVLVISFNSARVGLRLTIIDSSRLVATLTGVFAIFALRIIAFCKNGIFSSGTSRDRSPRSIRISSVSTRILSRFRTPRLLSILEIIVASGPAYFRNRATSSAVLANDKAKWTIPSSRPIFTAAMSSSVSGGNFGAGSITTALFEAIFPPLRTTVSAQFASVLSTSSTTPSKSSPIRLFGSSYSNTDAGVSDRQSLVPTTVSAVSRTCWRSPTTTSFSMVPVRTCAPSVSRQMGVDECD